MARKKEYDFDKHHAEVWAEIKSTVGEPVYPAWEDRIKHWEKRVSGMAPKGFMYVFDMRKDRTILCHGMDVLGYDDESMSSRDLMKFIHENHRKLFLYQTNEVHRILLKVNYRELGLKMYYAGYRVLKDRSGDYWLAYQTSEPFQLDANGINVSYLTWFHILAPYQGEGLQTFMFSGEKKDMTAFYQGMGMKLRKIRAEQLLWLNFDKTPLKIMNMYAKGYSSKEVVKTLGISQKTLYSHHLKINKRARLNFPLNNFRTVHDVIDYLKKQDLLPI